MTGSAKLNKRRDSNMELARIVAMIMIILGHFVFHGIQGTVGTSPVTTPVLGFDEYLILVVSCLCSAGVNLFMLISGYYGIRLKWQSIISFYLLCVFYNAVALFVQSRYQALGFRDIIDVIFISRTGNWFFKGYFWVMMVSPILNKAIKEFNLTQLRVLAAIGMILTCVSSCFLGNPKGNGALLLMFVYFLGGYIRRDDFAGKVGRIKALGLYFAICLTAIIVSAVVFNVFHKEYGIFFQHNSPFVVLAAVALFLFFKNISLNSGIVNSIASTVVAAIFIQDVIFYKPLYWYVNDCYISRGMGWSLWTYILALTAAVFLVSFIIEKPRKFIADRISSSLSKALDRLLPINAILNE